MTKKLLLGQKAPAFKATDVLGEQVNLSDFKNGYILIVFLRYSGCPWCNLAIHRLELELKQLKKDNCQVIAFVQSEKGSIIENVYDRHDPLPEFPVISDPDMKIYQQYAVNPTVTGSLKHFTNLPYWFEATRKLGFKQTKIDGNLLIVPAWFLVNMSTGKIVKREYNSSFYDHESFVKVYDSITFGD